MISKSPSRTERLNRRQCVACGCDDLSAFNRGMTLCVHCGCDFHLRPPRSYAEMEGFVVIDDDLPLRIDAPAQPLQRDRRLVHRWMAFLLMSMLFMMALLYLSALALPPG